MCNVCFCAGNGKHSVLLRRLFAIRPVIPMHSQILIHGINANKCKWYLFICKFSSLLFCSCLFISVISYSHSTVCAHIYDVNINYWFLWEKSERIKIELIFGVTSRVAQNADKWISLSTHFASTERNEMMYVILKWKQYMVFLLLVLHSSKILCNHEASECISFQPFFPLHKFNLAVLLRCRLEKLFNTSCLLVRYCSNNGSLRLNRLRDFFLAFVCHFVVS